MDENDNVSRHYKIVLRSYHDQTDQTMKKKLDDYFCSNFQNSNYKTRLKMLRFIS